MTQSHTLIQLPPKKPHLKLHEALEDYLDTNHNSLRYQSCENQKDKFEKKQKIKSTGPRGTEYSLVQTELELDICAWVVPREDLDLVWIQYLIRDLQVPMWVWLLSFLNVSVLIAEDFRP